MFWIWKLTNVQTYNGRTYESLKWGIDIESINLFQGANMRIGKIVNNAEYRMDEKFQNWEFFSQILFSKLKRFWKFIHFPIWPVPKIFNLENSDYLQFRKFNKLSIILWKFPIWNIRKIFNQENSKNLQFGIFQKFPICKIRKIRNLIFFLNS